MLGDVGMELTGSVGLVILKSSKRTLFLHLVHSGILDVEVLVKIYRHLVHSWVCTWELLINLL